ncbi:glycerol-3-phosphate 1-O-acyltransferase PlsY [Thermanaerovibrio acidaminovorans]|uniref:glycerol-3-phosphate 1-O-acyltransferase PlsY n=1 Tax=Thermanaerovibrio acidaminovorans TaxID=81462 RepID=UPI00248FA75B|nr:glycerol-3-phosphate 1-O-acyltransferase PlsY [Thermanaerovibrio acidaminovorans]
MSWLWPLIGYLAGSCPTGYLVVKLMRGEDIRNYGSGNIGATNVGRVMGRRWAITVALIDMLKGGAVVALAMAMGLRDHGLLAMTGLFGILGHNFPVWLRFKGGKGVATSFGVMFFYNWFCPWPALIGGALWYLVMKVTRYVSLASLVGLYACALAMGLFRAPSPYVAASFALALLSTARHKDNIRRLLAGTENRVGQKRV